MNWRFLNTILPPVVYRSGKRMFKTASMSASVPSDETQSFELHAVGLDNSAHLEIQENFSEQSFSSTSASCDTLQERENVVSATTADGSGDGTKLSKRALKRLRRSQMKKEKQGKKRKSDCNADLRQQSDVITKEILSESDYYFHDGLRKVYPYYFNYCTYVKERWFGLSLMSVFVKEFQNYSPETVKSVVESQSLTVNGSPTHVDYILKNGDFIQNRVHRHEMPVAARPIEILANTDDLLVINKPSSIPIHPCGRYRFNSILYILAKEKDFRNLRGLYRLDRLTSGILIFSKTDAKTKEMMELMRKRQLQKEYVCRVHGEFPSDPVECNEPIDALSHKLGIYRVGASGKESRTVFERMSYNGKTSVVKCKPHTGRTHQIRVHLQYIGFPIPNDPIYAGSVWGPKRGKGGDFGKSEEQLLEELQQRHSSSQYCDTGPSDTAAHSSTLHQSEPCVNTDADVSVSFEATQTGRVDDVASQQDAKPEESSAARLPAFDSSRMTFDPECRDCKLPDKCLSPDSLMMYLHAYSYQGPDWCFKTLLPQWAREDWTD